MAQIADDPVLNCLPAGQGSQTPLLPASSPNPKGHRWGGGGDTGALPALAGRQRRSAAQPRATDKEA